MPVELTIRVISPLAPEDKDLLTGVAIMTLAIANHELAKERFPETFTDDAETAVGTEREPTPCARIDRTDPARICIGDAGHRGRHRYHRIRADADTALPN
jgi:hypothetical protein